MHHNQLHMPMKNWCLPSHDKHCGFAHCQTPVRRVRSVELQGHRAHARIVVHYVDEIANTSGVRTWDLWTEPFDRGTMEPPVSVVGTIVATLEEP